MLWRAGGPQELASPRSGHHRVPCASVALRRAGDRRRRRPGYGSRRPRSEKTVTRNGTLVLARGRPREGQLRRRRESPATGTTGRRRPGCTLKLVAADLRARRGSRFTYQKPTPADLKPPMPQTPRPNLVGERVGHGQRAAGRDRVSSASPTAPSAVAPATLTRSPLPPVPRTEAVRVRDRSRSLDRAGVLGSSASVLPPVLTTRRSAPRRRPPARRRRRTSAIATRRGDRAEPECGYGHLSHPFLEG